MRLRPPRLAWLLFLLLAAGWGVQATEVPTLSRHVTDLTGTLSAQQVGELDSQLVDLEKRKGAQLVVLMVGTTGDQDIESYSLAVAEQNRVGRKGTDDGVLPSAAAITANGSRCSGKPRCQSLRSCMRMLKTPCARRAR